MLYRIMPNQKNPNPHLDWCHECGKYFQYRQGRDECPNCGAAITHARCCRCGNEWALVTRRPKQCPKCKNTRWYQMKDRKEGGI